MTTSHLVVNPQTLAPPVGFSHVVVAARGKTVFLGGQSAHDALGKIVGGTIPDQFDQACANVVTALNAASAAPEHLVSLQIFVTDVEAYRSSTVELGGIYRKHFGRHYPAIALLGVDSLFDPGAMVELVGIAVIPETSG
jgi:enamine deaminase RidA (YjgF/YER057c/UK114 family)